jgi:hypothetical protein
VKVAAEKAFKAEKERAAKTAELAEKSEEIKVKTLEKDSKSKEYLCIPKSTKSTQWKGYYVHQKTGAHMAMEFNLKFGADKKAALYPAAPVLS